MTALAEKRVASEVTRYEVRWPETGELLGYVLGVNGSVGPLGRALEENGLLVVAAGPSLTDAAAAGAAA